MFESIAKDKRKSLGDPTPQIYKFIFENIAYILGLSSKQLLSKSLARPYKFESIEVIL